MPAYAVAHLHSVNVCDAIVEYLNRIDATLAPFDGRFVIHGGRKEIVEGAWDGDLIVIEFPSGECARAWYGSPAYQAILPLRTAHSVGDVILIDGVTEPYHAANALH